MLNVMVVLHLYIISDFYHRFNIVGYGCMTCIGNSGPLPKEVENAITKVCFFFLTFLCAMMYLENVFRDVFRDVFKKLVPYLVSFPDL